jgi:hypothetical protein
MSRSERIAAQLGMSHGAAASKLRKSILFSLLVRLKENVCFKCGKVIYSPNELSIEHKLPWENIASNLFWDIENIAFSHMKCNVNHTRYGGSLKRKIGPDGTSWCTVCKEFHTVNKFHKDRTAWNGLQSHCIEFRPDR